jgi:hypothetical protein
MSELKDSLEMSLPGLFLHYLGRAFVPNFLTLTPNSLPNALFLRRQSLNLQHDSFGLDMCL